MFFLKNDAHTGVLLSHKTEWIHVIYKKKKKAETWGYPFKK